MKLVSYFKQLTADNQIAGGLGQGGGRYWEQVIGVMLQREIAKELEAELVLCSRPHGKDSFDRTDYDVVDGEFDIAYCQLFEVPKTRPAKWIYSIISDYISMESVLEDFLARTKPNVLISFQYPLNPPEGKPNLVHQCEAHGCKVVWLPWCNAIREPISHVERDIPAMCTGKIGGTYPNRDAIYKALEAMGRSDIVLSGNPHGSTFDLSDDGYHDALRRCRYYFSGGIYDIQIPPKYYEVLNYGATLVSHELPMMAEAGFIPDLTYIRLENLSEIPDIISSDKYKTIGPQGKVMVDTNHGLEARAMDIADVWRNDLR